MYRRKFLCAAAFGAGLLLAAPALAQAPSQDIGLGRRGFAQVGLQVRDIDRAISFYRDTLGLRLLFRAGSMVFFEVGHSWLMIAPGAPGHSATVYLDDPGLEAHQAALEARGVQFAGPIETLQRTPAYDLKLLEF